METAEGWVDFHCHLDHSRYDKDGEYVEDLCRNGSFTRLVTVANPHEEGSIERTAALLELNERILAAVGCHPHSADHYTEEIEKKIVAFTRRRRVVGIGEIGLDYHYRFSAEENQKQVFRRQLALARELALPVVIHARDAEREALTILDEERFDRDVVFHCFTGRADAAEEILKRGFFISFSGVITFADSAYLRAIAAETPLTQLFTETDAPFLSPEPFRGKRNSPPRVVHVAETIAELHGTTVEEVFRQAAENVERFFGLDREREH